MLLGVGAAGGVALAAGPAASAAAAGTGGWAAPAGAPVRLQVSRRPGARLPVGAVYVGRPGRWGNPYPRREHGTRAVELFRALVLADRAGARPGYPSLADIRRELAGRPLACWCPPGQPCHADVLLELANPTTPPIAAAAAGPAGRPQ